MSDAPNPTTKHTPGPWAWRWKSGSLHQVGTDRPFGATVLAPTYSYDEGVGIEVSDADDSLIAAAPDLLEALLSVRSLISEAAATGFNYKDGDWPERLYFSQQKTSAAIEKARGKFQ